MDLKTYAVHQKLEADSELLAYVVKGSPIPVPIVEENFRAYLEPLNDPAATRLIEDYAGLIGDEIPVTTQRMEDGGYTISGDIPDRLVEAIQLVHEVTPEEIVSALVNRNTAAIHGQALDIMDIDLSDAARHTLLGAMEIPKVQPAVLEPADPFAEAVAAAGTEPVHTEPARTAEAVHTEPARTAEAVPEKRIPETEMPEEEIPEKTIPEREMPEAESIDGAFPEEGAAMEAFPEEEEVPQEDPGASFRAAVSRVYDRLIADIRAYGLDQRLNLAL